MEKIEMSPIVFEPYLKRVIWGGNKLPEYKGLSAVEDGGNTGCIGESWEISGVEGRESCVSEGLYKGLTVKDLIARFGENMLGRRVVEKYGLQFPLLVKFIDAESDLSVQVHPDDALASRRHNCLGKTEVWYIIKSAPAAKIYSGLKRPISVEEYEQRVNDGTFQELLSVYDVMPGDVFFLPPGCVHSIGKGVLLAEIQESSDITYRIYDYGRRDADGKLRQLHTEMAKDAIDFEGKLGFVKRGVEHEGISDVEIVNDEHFIVRRIAADFEKKEYTLLKDSLTIILNLDGELEIAGEWGNTRIGRGRTVLLPAGLEKILIGGSASALLVQI